MPTKPTHSQLWTKRATALVWLITFIGVITVAKVHITGPVVANLFVQEVSFKTNSSNILGPTDQAEFIVSGLSQISFDGSDIQLSIDDVPTQTHAGKVVLTGETASTCTFQNFRVSPLNPENPSTLTMFWRKLEKGTSFGLRTHGVIDGTLTGDYKLGVQSEFSCDHIMVDNRIADNISGSFMHTGDIWFSSNADAQLDFRSHSVLSFEETQIRVLSDMRISHIEPGQPPRETTVLLEPPSGQQNSLSFPRANIKKEISASDLLLIEPTNGFYIKDIKIDRGIQLTLQGRAKDVKEGAGAKDLVSVMPSAFDEMDNKKRIFAVIPAIATTLLSVFGISRKTAKSDDE